MSEHLDMDPFWVERRAEFLAAKSTSADPSACGTCRGNVADGKPVEHDECAQRATLLHAPDHPYYEILAGFSLEENAKLPARFHVPVFDDCGVPNSWLCAVCQDEGTVTGWPCATAIEQGAKVFSPLHPAETAAEKQAERIALLERKVDSLKAELKRSDDEFEVALRERDRYRTAWQSARQRAQAYGEGILRVVEDRESYQGWLKQAEARIVELERPAVEAKRNEIRQSYTALISQAEQDRDHEGAATLALQLRDSEAKWQREDEAVTS